MAAEYESYDARIKIDLNSPSGNAYVLLGYAKELSSLLDLNWDVIQQEMTEKDYENLVSVFRKYFSDWVILNR